MDFTFNKAFLIGTELVKRQYITQDQLDEALIFQQRHPKYRLGEVLMQLKYITQEDLDRVIADQLGIMYVDFTTYEIPAAAIEKFPKELVKSYNAVPVGCDESSVTVCVADPLDKKVCRGIQDYVEYEIKWAISNKQAIRDAIAKYYQYE